MSLASDFHTSERAQLVGGGMSRLPSLLVTGAIVVLVGQEVVAAQRDAMTQCSPGCNMLGYSSAAVDAVLATPGAIASVWVGPFPLGWIVLGGLCLFLLQFVRADPV